MGVLVQAGDPSVTCVGVARMPTEYMFKPGGDAQLEEVLSPAKKELEQEQRLLIVGGEP